MSPVIRVDEDVWKWLKSHAQPLEDTPNSVLRRLAGIEAEGQLEGEPRAAPSRADQGIGPRARVAPRTRVRTNYGRELNEKWHVNARHAMYHKDGNYYNHLRRFPGALFDPKGYVIFKTEQEYLRSPYLQHGTQLHVPGGIGSLPGYVQAKAS